METHNQGGRDGGRKPPPTALGYFGESDDDPKQPDFSSKEQDLAVREVGSLLLAGSPFFKFLKSAVAEFRRLNWPTPTQIGLHAVVTLGLVSLISLPLWSLGQFCSRHL